VRARIRVSEDYAGVHAFPHATSKIGSASAQRQAIFLLGVKIFWGFLDLALGEIHRIIMRTGNNGSGDR
jgi:hypothetical protein